MAVSAPTMSMLLSAVCAQQSAHCHQAAADDGGKAHHMMQQCGYCVLQADLPAAPPPAGLAVQVVEPPSFVYGARHAAPAPLQPRLAPPPRAPPFA